MQRHEMVGGPVLPDPASPLDGESLPSLIARYAGDIGFTRPSWVLAPLGLGRMPLVGLATGPHDEETTSALGRLLGLDDGTFARLRSWTSSPDHLRVLGHELPDWMVRFTQRRFCPGCLAEAPFHRAVWDVTLLPGCGRHRTVLRDACATCARAPRWVRTSPHRCSRLECDADLSGQVADVALPPAEAETCLRIERMFHEGVPEGHAPLSVGDTLAAAIRLGTYALGLPWKAMMTATRRTELDVARAMTLGLAALDDWPRGLHRCLEGLRGSGDRRSHRSAFKSLGPIMVWLRDERDTSLGEVLCPAVNAWIADQSDVATRMRGVDSIRDDARRPVMSVTQAARQLGIRPPLMRDVAERHGLYRMAPDGSGVMALIDSAALRRLVAGRVDATDRPGACALLGVSKEVLVPMIELGLVEELPMERRIHRELDLDRGQLRALLARLEATALEPGPVAGSRSLKATVVGMPGGIPVLLKAVLDGMVSPVGIDAAAKGVNRLLFSPATRNAPSQRLPDGYVEPGDLAGMLGIDRTSMTEMVAAGLFGEDEAGVWHRKRRPVSLEAIERFRRECIMTPEISSASGLPWQGLAARLGELGVIPISGPGVDGLRRHVFRRLEVDVVMTRLREAARLRDRQIQTGVHPGVRPRRKPVP